ncbi:PREDICTED: jerky protein homolog-like [Dufourea novaeangliae]|uniref:jerky protein homolog-like n=1 Tax=Dufourea novaeangliae TaxID=178035 RepID=UPI000767241A|nr:PREDICTED: jerky protein homolog-like [Dufourea novaeangliae]
MESNNKLRRAPLSMKQRLEIVQHLESGVSISTLAAEYDVAPVTVRRIKRNAVTVSQFTDQGFDKGHRKTLRRPVNEELDNRLYTWFVERKTLSEPITDLLMVEKAAELNREIGGPSGFKASRGWLWRFKNRHGIRLFVQNDDTSTVAAQQFVETFVRHLEEEDIDKENVYNMNATSLSWKTLSKKIFDHSGEKRIEEKNMNKDRVTIGLCANVTGSHKLVPLFINRFENPRVLKYWKHRLPVIYKAQQQAFMDQTVFADWYQNYFKPDVMKYQLHNGTCGKVVLLLDNSREYNIQYLEELQGDERFQIVFLPPNTSHLLQPIDQVLEKTKKAYRHKMLNRAMSYPDGIQEFYSNYDLKDCIHLLYEAWLEMSVLDIQNSWKNLIKQVAEGEPENLFESTLEIIDIEEQEERTTDFLSKCIETKNHFLEKTESFSNGDNQSSLLGTLSDKGEIIKALKTLMIWSKEESEIIKLNVKYLKDYYELR